MCHLDDLQFWLHWLRLEDGLELVQNPLPLALWHDPNRCFDLPTQLDSLWRQSLCHDSPIDELHIFYKK